MSKPLRLLLSGFWLSFAVTVILAALLLSAVRLALPVMGQHRDEVAAWVSDLVGQPVHIGALRAGWHGWGPSLELKDVTVLDAKGQRPVLQCASARIDMNLPASLLHWQFEPGLLTVRGAHISLERRGDGSIRVTGWGGGAPQDMDEAGRNALKQWLQRQERLALSDSVLEWHDGGRVLQFTGVNLQLRNYGDRHRLDATADLPPSLGQRLEVAMDVQGDLFTTAFWQGKVYVRGTALQLDGWWDGQLPQGLSTLSGVVDFQLWSGWLNGIEKVEGQVQARDLRAVRAAAGVDGTEGGELNLDALSGGFHWQRRPLGWNMDVDKLTLTRSGATLPPMAWQARYNRDGRSGGYDLRLAFDELPVADAAAMLRDADALPADWQPHLAALAPQGLLQHGYLLYHTDPQRPRHVELSGDFSGVGWRPDAKLPGAQGLAGHVVADETRGEVTLDSDAAVLDAPKLFRAPVTLGAAAGHIAWQRDDQGLVIDAGEMSLHNPDVALRFTLHTDVPANGASPYLDLDAHFEDGNAAHLPRYLPVGIMHPTTVAWLERAIVNGHISDGSVRFTGRLADFPFDDPQQGQFDVRFKVADGILDYAKGWPRLDEVNAELHFHGRRFDAEAAGLKTLGSGITEAHVTIPDMSVHPARLLISGTAQGTTGEMLRYLGNSPLHKTFGAYLADAAGGGSSELKLSLDLPLDKELPPRVNGAVHFNDGSLLFRDSGIDVTHITGILNFTEGGLSADGIKAELLGQPVILGAATRPGESGNVIRFTAQGTADTAVLARRFAPSFAAYLAGSAPWQGELRIPPRRDGWAELQIHSSLQGVKVSLPPPMAKSADEVRNLLVQIPLPLKDGRPLHLRYGDVADAQLILNKDGTGPRVARGELRFGGNAVLPEQNGLRVAGTLSEFDAGQWSALAAGQQSGSPPGAALGLTQVDMTFGVLKAGAHQLDKVQLKANRANAAWDIHIDSEQLQGRIQRADDPDAPLVMDLERLYLPRFKKGGGGETPPDPRHLPPLDIRAKDFRYSNLDLGALRLHAIRIPAGLHFDDVHAHSAQRDLQIQGDWWVDAASQHSAFTLNYDGADAGDTLTALGFAGVINGGKTHTAMQLKWQGAPPDFALAKAAGSINFEIKDGRLLDVEPGAGRILGLLSVQALPRRLTLDFTDLFRKGFYFDSLAGSFTIENGNAQTDNLHMVGPSARIETRGRVGLATEDYDQKVTVIPNLSAGLPVAGVLAAGVGAGAALLLAEKILKPGIDKITQVEYRVTGSWANPNVERLTLGSRGSQN